MAYKILFALNKNAAMKKYQHISSVVKTSEVFSDRAKEKVMFVCKEQNSYQKLRAVKTRIIQQKKNP